MNTAVIPLEKIENKIHSIRGKKVMLDSDLAGLYGVETRSLIQSIKRNIKRFPEDFMFQITEREYKALRSQFVISKKGGRRYLPYAFTEQGVSMLSSVLNSNKAIQVNIQIMRTFSKLKEFTLAHKDIAVKLNKLERKVKTHDNEIEQIFKAIKQLITPPEKPKRKVGFCV